MNKPSRDNFSEASRSCSLTKIQNNNKVILALSTLMLGVSLAFVLYVTPVGKHIEILFLQLSQFVLLLAIITAFSSFLTHKKVNSDPPRYRDKKGTISRWLHYVSILFLIIGVAFTAVFIYSNIHMK